MKSIILLSPPAAGKGTQAQLLKEKYNIPHISIGAILRNEVERKTAVGLNIKEDMKKGNLIDDDIIMNLLINRIKQKDCEKGFILDGFPRTLKQAKLYDKFLKENNMELNYVFHLKIDKETARKRIVGRLICSNCQAVYNELLKETKPKASGICDKCNGILVRRKDDNNDVFENRYQLYLIETMPVISYYQNQNKLYEIDSSIDKNYTFKQITKILDIGGDYN
ncbi:MAG: adenylate kinase [Mollicutes bacterium]|nr:adenylate kinase [Mollicutes bacterium]